MSTRHGMRLTEDVQSDGDVSFIGGKPRLPAGERLPACVLCNSPLTFFFQLAFPADHPWAGHSLAAFACTRCADERYLIPEMLRGALPGADVPTSFLYTYQRNFRALVFTTDTAAIVPGYGELVRFRRMSLLSEASSDVGHVGGAPRWLMDDETPRAVGGAAPAFLFQLEPGVTFPIHPDAPGQVELALDGSPAASENPFYKLFIGNGTYVFGAQVPESLGVYVVTQVT
jgi:hypothetical protein